MMENLSKQLLLEIKNVRQLHAVLLFFTLIIIAGTVWLFQYSNFTGSFFYKILAVIFVIPLGSLIYSRVNSGFKVLCPRCQSLIEQGRLPGEPIPLCCPKCRLPIKVSQSD